MVIVFISKINNYHNIAKLLASKHILHSQARLTKVTLFRTLMKLKQGRFYVILIL
jgi:hypothetical protein